MKAPEKSIPEFHPYVTAKGGVVILNGPFPMEQAEQIKALCEAVPELIKHLRWINDIIGTACDGGDAWCAVRDRPGASEWAKGMENLLASLGFPAKVKKGKRR